MREDCDKSAMRKYMIFLPPPVFCWAKAAATLYRDGNPCTELSRALLLESKNSTEIDKNHKFSISCSSTHALN